MKTQKLLIMLLMSVFLGQSILVSAEVHIAFDGTDPHQGQHQLTDGPEGETYHSSDTCGHCCHSHCNFSLHSSSKLVQPKLSSKLYAHYSETPYSFFPDPALRPPIA